MNFAGYLLGDVFLFISCSKFANVDASKLPCFCSLCFFKFVFMGCLRAAFVFEKVRSI